MPGALWRKTKIRSHALAPSTMSSAHTAPGELLEQLQKRFAPLPVQCSPGLDMTLLECPPSCLLEVCEALFREPEFSFEQLSDLCGVDYSTYAQSDWETNDATNTGFSRGVRWGEYQETAPKTDAAEPSPNYAVLYHLLSLRYNRRLRLRCRLPADPPQVPSVVSIWNSANWYEREAFDLFGILFDGHPDLRRILTDYGFIGHPFRKDFPLHGKVEVRYDPNQGRVIYQPVTIENRVLVPRVIRNDNRYLASDEENNQ